MSSPPRSRPQEFLYDPEPESSLVPFTIDPRYVRLRRFGPNLMQEYAMGDRPIVKRNFFGRLLHRCVDAWLPARRRNRDRKLMPHPKPMVDLCWWIYGRFKGKAWREKPWGVQMDYGDDLAGQYPEWRLEILRMLASDTSFPHETPLIDERPAIEESRPIVGVAGEHYGTRPRRYRLVDHGRAIECLTCGYASYNPNDIRERYCGRCHHFHGDAGYPGRQREIMSAIDSDGRPPLQTMIE